MVTHIHPDHYGLAGRVREISDAWIALHPADARLIHDRYEEPTDLLERMGGMLRKLGAPRERARRAAQRVDAGAPVRRLRRARRAHGGRRPARHARAGTSPRCGHPATPPATSASGRRRNRLMLTGDCVLPRITPNVNLNPQTEPDPLGDYLRSLERLADFDADRGAACARVALRGPPRPPARDPRPPRAPVRRGDRRGARRLRHRVGGRAAHGLVAPVGPDRRVHAPLRHRRGLRAPARRSSMRGVLEESEGEPSRWKLVEA